VQIVAGRSLSKNWTICSAHSIFLKTEVSEPQNDLEAPTSNQGVIYQPTFAFMRKLSPKADFFTEYVGNFQKSTLSNQIVDCAALYRFRRNQQFSTRLGIGLTKASPTAFVEFGYSVLLGNEIIRDRTHTLEECCLRAAAQERCAIPLCHRYRVNQRVGIF